MTVSFADPGAPPTPRSAQVLGAVGGALGVVVGAVELAFGASIRSWVGDKYDTVGLGAATISLAAIALASSIVLPRVPATPAARLAIALVLLGSGAVCFTTAGRLWWLPGSMICSAGVVTIWSLRNDVAAIRDALVDRMLDVLLVVLGLYLVALGATVVGSSGGVGGLGMAGGMAVAGLAIAAGHLPRPSVTVGVVIAVTPIVALTWWSLITPVIAALALVLAAISDRGRRAHQHHHHHQQQGLPPREPEGKTP